MVCGAGWLVGNGARSSDVVVVAGNAVVAKKGGLGKGKQMESFTSGRRGK